MSNEVALIIAIIGFIVSILSIISFVLTRREKGRKEGVEYGEMEQDIKFIKNAQTSVILGQEKISTKLDIVNEKVIRLEEKYKSVDKRLTKIEKDKEG